MKRYALVDLNGLAERIANTITSQLASRGCTITVTAIEPDRYATPEHETRVLARNVAQLIGMVELDDEDPQDAAALEQLEKQILVK